MGSAASTLSSVEFYIPEDSGHVVDQGSPKGVTETTPSLKNALVTVDDYWLIPKLIHYLGYQQSLEMMQWNSSWSTLKRQELYWKALCYALCDEYKLYLPQEVFHIKSWKTSFEDLHSNRTLWTLPSPEVEDLPVVDGDELPPPPVWEERTFHLKVCARFRPEVATAGGDIDEDDNEEARKPIVLPLHQRIALIMASNPGLSKKESMSLLFNKLDDDGNPWEDAEVKFKDSFNTGAVAASAREEAPAIDVNESTIAKVDPALVGNYRASIMSVNPKQGKILACAPSLGLKEFHFDGVFSAKDGQCAVYNNAASEAVVDVLNGFNSGVIVFGQTGSGKTYTMFGEHEDEDKKEPEFKRGIIPRACKQLLHAAAEREKRYGIKSEVNISFVEIFGEDAIGNLLDDGKPLGPSVVAGHRYVLEGRGAVQVSTFSEIQELIKVGITQRRSASTAMNERSSRSHSIFIFDLKQKDPVSERTVSSKLFLVDLGGSEQLKQSKVTGDRLAEAVNINRGLLAMKSCIDALNTKKLHVPFKNSRLTMLLSEVLGGDSKTTIIITGAPEQRHAIQTIRAMQFGETCQAVENRATTNFDSLTSVIEELNQEIATKEAEIAAKEKWVTFKVAQVDKFDGKMLVNQSELVGAESERNELEALLTKKRALLGNIDVKEDADVVHVGTTTPPSEAVRMEEIEVNGEVVRVTNSLPEPSDAPPAFSA